MERHQGNRQPVASEEAPEPACRPGGPRWLCLHCSRFLCGAWMYAVKRHVLRLHGCIIISIYQLALFSEGKVRSLRRCLCRINRSVLDCITDIACPHMLPTSSHSVGPAPALGLRSCRTPFMHHPPVHRERNPLLVPPTSCLPPFLVCTLFVE